jgi:hypothetical protein
MLNVIKAEIRKLRRPTLFLEPLVLRSFLQV